MKKIIKILSIVMVLAIAVCSLASCGTDNAVTAEAGKADEATQANQAKSGDLIFGTNAEFPPFEYVSAAGVIDTFDGIDMQIAKKIAEDNGYTPKISNIEFDSLIISLQKGQIDAIIAGMTITEDRKESVDFSIPYYTATQVMIVKDGSEIKKATDMDGKTIAVVQGYTGETVVEKMGYEHVSFKKGTECIMELVNGKCDVVVIDSATAQKYVADNDGLVIVEDESAFENEEYGIAVKKGNTQLLDKINASIETMLANGTISSWAAQYTDNL